MRQEERPVMVVHHLPDRLSCFAISRNTVVIAVLFVFYCLYQARHSDFVPEHLRASGVGWYNTTVGGGLVASIVAGLLWDHIGHGAVVSL
jgi:hypothetical protein